MVSTISSTFSRTEAERKEPLWAKKQQAFLIQQPQTHMVPGWPAGQAQAQGGAHQGLDSLSPHLLSISSPPPSLPHSHLTTLAKPQALCYLGVFSLKPSIARTS